MVVTWERVTLNPYLAMDAVCAAIERRRSRAPASALCIAQVHVTDNEIQNGGFSQLVYNHGVEQLVRARDAMRAIGAVAAVPLFERAVAICNHADKELEVYRRGSYFDDPAPIGERDRTGRTPLERARWNLWRMECAGDEQGANDTLTKSGDYVFDHAWTDVLERLGR